MKTKIRILRGVLVLTLMSVLAGLAMAAGNETFPPRTVLSGGASYSTAEGVALRATLGQPMVGLVTGGAGQGVTLGQGFWHGGSLAGGGYDIYLPLVTK